jgi:predicted 3-demethylubiquinone-9 3-methyltransferase (glyoxalase superfamily)
MTTRTHHEVNDAVSIVVTCSDRAELDRCWDALIVGGGVAQACAGRIDRWGLRWRIVPAQLDVKMADPDPVRSRRVTDAMREMIELDVATLEAAHRG